MISDKQTHGQMDRLKQYELAFSSFTSLKYQTRSTTSFSLDVNMNKLSGDVPQTPEIFPSHLNCWIIPVNPCYLSPSHGFNLPGPWSKGNHWFFFYFWSKKKNRREKKHNEQSSSLSVAWGEKMVFSLDYHVHREKIFGGKYRLIQTTRYLVSMFCFVPEVRILAIFWT